MKTAPLIVPNVSLKVRSTSGVPGGLVGMDILPLVLIQFLVNPPFPYTAKLKPYTPSGRAQAQKLPLGNFTELCRSDRKNVAIRDASEDGRVGPVSG